MRGDGWTDGCNSDGDWGDGKSDQIRLNWNIEDTERGVGIICGKL